MTHLIRWSYHTAGWVKSERKSGSNLLDNQQEMREVAESERRRADEATAERDEAIRRNKELEAEIARLKAAPGIS